MDAWDLTTSHHPLLPVNQRKRKYIIVPNPFLLTYLSVKGYSILYRPLPGGYGSETREQVNDSQEGEHDYSYEYSGCPLYGI